jgi:hypothetical protein
LNSFVEKHPGGKDWISLTKLPRNYNFVFKPDGFYLTLKKRVMEILPTLDQSAKKTSNVSLNFFYQIFKLKFKILPQVKPCYYQDFFVQEDLSFHGVKTIFKLLHFLYVSNLFLKKKELKEIF